MGLGAEYGDERPSINLPSVDGAFDRTRKPQPMPHMHGEELRDSLDGMTIELRRDNSIGINPRETATNLIAVIFGTDIVEGDKGHTVTLKIIASDATEKGVSYRMNPDEICLVQKFDEPNQHDVRIDALWNSEMGFLEFEGLRFGSRYVLAFTSAGAGGLAELSGPPAYGESGASSEAEY